MARDTERRRRPRGDQAAAVLLLWALTVALFGFVAWQIATATGADPSRWLPAVSPRDVGLVMLALVLMSVAGWRLSARRASALSGRAAVRAPGAARPPRAPPVER